MGQKKRRRPQLAPDELDHEATRELLHAYAHEVLMGERPETRYSTVAAHLARCAECRADLEEMLEITRMAADPPGIPSLACPQLDLARLPRPWQAPGGPDRAWFIDRFRRLWVEFSQPLLQAWQPSSLLGAARGVLLFTYQQDAGSHDPGLHINIYAEDTPATVLVSVTVDVPDQNALDQSGLPVSIYIDDAIRLAKTDRSGTARFAMVPRDALERLRLAITLDRSA